jgi:hypothetical protein
VVLWGALAFVTALLFDRWWLAGYGLAAGIWHPPQMLKTAAFFAVTAGAALCVREDRIACPAAGAAMLAMIAVVSLVGSYPNRQHSAPFFEIACATYPIVIVAIATAGRLNLSGTLAALGYLLLAGALVWLLPLVPATPQVAPIYNPRDHLMPRRSRCCSWRPRLRSMRCCAFFPPGKTGLIRGARRSNVGWRFF